LAGDFANAGFFFNVDVEREDLKAMDLDFLLAGIGMVNFNWI
jgi:hypothetical protein